MLHAGPVVPLKAAFFPSRFRFRAVDLLSCPCDRAAPAHHGGPTTPAVTGAIRSSLPSMSREPTGTPGAAATPDRRSYAALRYPAARTYLALAALAMAADHVEHAISYWIIYEKFHSSFLAGFAVISHWLPFLVGSVCAGALADRYDTRRIIQIGMLMFMAVSAGWGVLFWTNSLEQWHAVILLIVHGCAGALWAPAGQVLIHNVVGTPQLQSGIRLMATSITLGVLIGPAIGGTLLYWFGPSVGIIVNILIYLPMLLWLIRNPAMPAAAERQTSNRVTSYRELFGAVQQVAKIPVVMAMTLLAAVSASLVGNAWHPHLPAFAADFGFGAEGYRYTVLLTANAFGAVAAGLLLEYRSLIASTPRNAFVLAILWCTAILGFAVAPGFAAGVALLVAAGFFELSFISMARALAQLHAPPELRGRAIGLFNVGAMGCRIFAGATIGFGGGLIGIHWSLGISAAALLVVLLALLGWTYRAAARAEAP
jgi:MFS family permease